MSLSFRSPIAIVQAIQGFLELAQWGGELAFQRVAVFDSTDLEKALEELLVYESRIALVIYTGDRWEHLVQKEAQTVVSRRITQVTVILSDRVLGNRASSVWGGSDNPGCVVLHELAIEAVAGDLFNTSPRVISVPLTSENLYVERDGANSPGRSAISIDVECTTEFSELAA